MFLCYSPEADSFILQETCFLLFGHSVNWTSFTYTIKGNDKPKLKVNCLEILITSTNIFIAIPRPVLDPTTGCQNLTKLTYKINHDTISNVSYSIKPTRGKSFIQFNQETSNFPLQANYCAKSSFQKWESQILFLRLSQSKGDAIIISTTIITTVLISTAIIITLTLIHPTTLWWLCVIVLCWVYSGRLWLPEFILDEILVLATVMGSGG